MDLSKSALDFRRKIRHHQKIPRLVAIMTAQPMAIPAIAPEESEEEEAFEAVSVTTGFPPLSLPELGTDVAGGSDVAGIFAQL